MAKRANWRKLQLAGASNCMLSEIICESQSVFHCFYGCLKRAGLFVVKTIEAFPNRDHSTTKKKVKPHSCSDTNR